MSPEVLKCSSFSFEYFYVALQSCVFAIIKNGIKGRSPAMPILRTVDGKRSNLIRYSGMPSKGTPLTRLATFFVCPILNNRLPTWRHLT